MDETINSAVIKQPPINNIKNEPVDNQDQHNESAGSSSNMSRSILGMKRHTNEDTGSIPPAKRTPKIEGQSTSSSEPNQSTDDDEIRMIAHVNNTDFNSKLTQIIEANGPPCEIPPTPQNDTNGSETNTTSTNKYETVFNKNHTEYRCCQCYRTSRILEIIEFHMNNCKGIDIRSLYQCHLCFSEFDDDEKFAKHMSNDHKVVSCRICDHKYLEEKPGDRAVGTLKNHSCYEFGTTICLKCGSREHGFKKLYRHELECMENQVYLQKCSKCYRISFSKQLMDEHKSSCVAQNFAKIIDCTLCLEKFETVTQLMVHINTNHSISNKLSCLICEEVFTSGTLEEHYNLEYEVYRCIKCNELFNNQKSLIAHEISEHVSPDHEQQSTSMNTSSSSLLDLSSLPNNSLNTDSSFGRPGPKKKIKNTCKYCKKIMYVSEAHHTEFLEHQATCPVRLTDSQVAEGEANCLLCCESFVRALDWVQHIKMEHKPDIINCPICGNVQENYEKCVLHLTLELGETTCPRCGAQFDSVRGRVKHQKNVCSAGVIRLVNEYCKKCQIGGFHNDVVDHSKICDGDPTQFEKCLVSDCPKKFLNRDSMYLHVREHENGAELVKRDRTRIRAKKSKSRRNAERAAEEAAETIIRPSNGLAHIPITYTQSALTHQSRQSTYRESNINPRPPIRTNNGSRMLAIIPDIVNIQRTEQVQRRPSFLPPERTRP